MVPADLELKLRLPCNGTREIPQYAGARNRVLRSDAVSRARRPHQVEAPAGLGQRESKSGAARLRRRKGQPRARGSRRRSERKQERKTDFPNLILYRER